MNRDVHRFKRYVRDTLGIELPDKSAETMGQLLAFRLKELSYTSVDEYVKKLIERRESKREYQMLVNVVTNNKTAFFRHANQLRSIEKVLVGLGRKKLNIWTAGCATGEEAYTLAILLQRNQLDGQVLGTDVDEVALRHARAGVYEKWRIEGLEQQLDGYITDRDMKSVAMTEEIKNQVRFDVLNLMTKKYPRPDSGKWDIILCRNVLIYFSKKAFKLATKRFNDVIRDAGYFVLSPAEAMPNDSEQFVLEQAHGNYFYKQSSVPPKPYPSLPPNENLRKSVSSNRRAFGDSEVPLGWDGTRRLTEEVAHRENNNTALSATDSDGPGVAKAIKIYESGDRIHAVDLLKKYLKKHPEDVGTAVTLGNALVGLRDLRGAEDQYARALDLDPLLAEIHFFMGMLHRKSGNWEQSARSFRNALFLSSGLWIASFYQAGVWMKLGDAVRAQRKYRITLRELEDDNSTAFRFISQLHFLDDATRYRKDIAVVCRKRLSELRMRPRSGNPV